MNGHRAAPPRAGPPAYGGDALRRALSRHVDRLCDGLETGEAPVLAQVAPVTAGLLRWWFADALHGARGGGFHPGQRRAILDVVVAHELLAATGPADLRRSLGLDLEAAAVDASGHPHYPIAMTPGSGALRVLQALLVWQLLNAGTPRQAGGDDPRFTRRFLIVAAGAITRERLLHAFLGPAAADGSRDPDSAGIVRAAALLAPPEHRQRLLRFVRQHACVWDDIDPQTIDRGLLAVAGQRQLLEADAALQALREGAAPGPQAVMARLLPVLPGKGAGNGLDALNARRGIGRTLAALQGCPDLMVFDPGLAALPGPARRGQDSRGLWSQALARLAAGKSRRFLRIELPGTAAPRQDARDPPAPGPPCDPVAVFDLARTIALGAVKLPLLDRQPAIAGLPAAFRTLRQDRDRPQLCASQDTLLRTGLQTLLALERGLSTVDPQRPPKLLVLCDEGGDTPLAAAWLAAQGMPTDAVLIVDPGRKPTLGENAWAALRGRLVGADRRPHPRAIVTVSTLRERFDLAGICVIVALRAAGSGTTPEQVLAHGLRPMWPQAALESTRRGNRERAGGGRTPASRIDVLTVVEHPRFWPLYEPLLHAGLCAAGSAALPADGGGITGDLALVGLRDDHARYDIAIPVRIEERHAPSARPAIDIAALPPYRGMCGGLLAGMTTRGGAFAAPDLHHPGLFADLLGEDGVAGILGYNDLLARLVRRIAHALNQPLPAHGHGTPLPYLQQGTAPLAEALDRYIRTRLFDAPFDPRTDPRWRVLAMQPLVEHIVRVVGLALAKSGGAEAPARAAVQRRRLSDAGPVPMRTSTAMATTRCVHPCQDWPARNGRILRDLLVRCEADGEVEAFCRLAPGHHDFARLRWMRSDGQVVPHLPDLLVRTRDAVYLVDAPPRPPDDAATRLRRERAIAAWCARVNTLPADARERRQWRHAPLDDALLRDAEPGRGGLCALLALGHARAMARTLPAASPPDRRARP